MKPVGFFFSQFVQMKLVLDDKVWLRDSKHHKCPNSSVTPSPGALVQVFSGQRESALTRNRTLSVELPLPFTQGNNGGDVTQTVACLQVHTLLQTKACV